MLLYRCLLSLFALVVLVRAARQDGLAGLKARLGLGPVVDAPHVWLHGASNGELASVRPVLTRLIAARPDLHWLITTNSATGQQMARAWDLPRCSVRPAPLDLQRVSRRMMRRWDVRAHISLESELWPHRFAACPGPVLLLGARLSDGTARAWSRMPRLARRLLAQVRLASAQDADSARRLAELGLPDSAQGPVFDLKALYEPPETTPDAALTHAFPRDRTWLAASTHEGEDATVLDAHAALLDHAPETRLILAPRHPQRAEAIARAAQARGLTVARRSLHDAPDAQVYIADTLGEMALWYRLAGRVFIGGTLTDRGGHTPYEPASFGCALIHGPDTRNFAAPFARLAKAGAARQVAEAAALAEALLALGPSQHDAGLRAREALRQDSAPGDFVARILATLPAVGKS